MCLQTLHTGPRPPALQCSGAGDHFGFALLEPSKYFLLYGFLCCAHFFWYLQLIHSPICCVFSGIVPFPPKLWDVWELPSPSRHRWVPTAASHPCAHHIPPTRPRRAAPVGQGEAVGSLLSELSSGSHPLLQPLRVLSPPQRCSVPIRPCERMDAGEATAANSPGRQLIELAQAAERG